MYNFICMLNQVWYVKLHGKYTTHTMGYMQSFEPHFVYMCTGMYTEGIYNYVLITSCVQTIAECYLVNAPYVRIFHSIISTNASILFATSQPLKYSSII